ncbi:MAG: NUDIX hydrolase [Maritimibacter sp.]|jgi:8-oxo-dGTP pyrophosphatase MutT (NUDIX family)
MINRLTKTFDEVLRPLWKRPNRVQVAALCYRKKKGRKEVLLITTRGTGRWMLPKGWPMDGKTGAEAARIEAWEEAGVRSGTVSRRPVGVFDYMKNHDDGLVEPCTATVYPIKVDKVLKDYPESGERKRKWVGIEKAAKMVDEDSLSELLLDF